MKKKSIKKITVEFKIAASSKKKARKIIQDWLDQLHDSFHPEDSSTYDYKVK